MQSFLSGRNTNRKAIWNKIIVMLVLRLQVYIFEWDIYTRCQENKNTSDEKRHTNNNDIQHECSLHYSVMLARTHTHIIFSAANRTNRKERIRFSFTEKIGLVCMSGFVLFMGTKNGKYIYTGTRPHVNVIVFVFITCE